jgi:hypothetical protein
VASSSISRRSIEGVLNVDQGSSGAVGLSAGLWSYSFAWSAGHTWKLAQIDIPDAVQDAMERIRALLSGVNKDNVEALFAQRAEEVSRMLMMEETP